MSADAVAGDKHAWQKSAIFRMYSGLWGVFKFFVFVKKKAYIF